MPDRWCPADPEIGEHGVLAALLDNNHHLIREGQILLTDKGFSGKPRQKLAESTGLRLLRPDRKDETYRNDLGGVRQWIESVNQTFKGATRPGTARRTHPARRVHPHRAPSTGHGRRHLAQLANRRDQQTIAHSLRSPTPTSPHQPFSRSGR
ncbi:MAG TPA: hypothetical protein VJT49_21490 [Amycolatopsis sp.]|nr:hypothetical protein [Amycolatopsis sp.]HKS47635.1 hypothetical protein [Amycolatopsis sp.]